MPNIKYILVLLFFNLKVLGQPALIIPAEFEDNRLYIRGFINDEPCRFLFDTGNTGLVIDSDFKNKTGLTQKDAFTNGLPIKLGPYNTSEKYFVSRAWNKYSKGTFQAILGWNFFKDYLVELDYQNSTINLYTSSSQIKTEYKTDPIYATRKGTFLEGLFFTKASFELEGKRFEGEFFIDTGSSRNISLLKNISKRSVRIANKKVSLKKDFSSPHGFNKPIYIKIQEFNILNKTFDNLIIDANTDTEFSGGDGIVGGHLLKNFKILIDTNNKMLRLSDHTFSTDFYEKLITDGVHLKEDLGNGTYSGDFQIYSSKDLKVEIKKSDVILQINDINIDNISKSDYQQMTEKKGDTLKYLINRNGKKLIIKTTLKELL